MEGLIFGGKFAFQNRFGLALQLEVNLLFLLCIILYLRAYIWRGDLTEGFLRYRVGGGRGIFGGAYTWRGLFSEFYGMLRH